MNSKILINNNITERINTGNYPGCSFSYQSDKDITVKISKFLQLTGLTNRTLKPSQVQKHTGLEIFSFQLKCDDTR